MEIKELSMENKVEAGWEKIWQREGKAASEYLQSAMIEGEELFRLDKWASTQEGSFLEGFWTNPFANAKWF